MHIGEYTTSLERLQRRPIRRMLHDVIILVQVFNFIHKNHQNTKKCLLYIFPPRKGALTDAGDEMGGGGRKSQQKKKKMFLYVFSMEGNHDCRWVCGGHLNK